MSSNIVRSIKIRDNKVFITSACNNVIPHDYKEWNSPFLSKILQDKGKDALELSIFKKYEDGSFQGRSIKKYTNALEKLVYDERFCDEYKKKYDWMNNFPYKSERYNEIKKNRGSSEFDKFLMKVLKSSSPKDRFIIYNPIYKLYFYYKRGSSLGHWVPKGKATRFKYRKEAMAIKKNFGDHNIWSIEKEV